MGKVFQIALRGKRKILLPQCNGMINFAGVVFLLGGGYLKRSDFDSLENCYLVKGKNIWWAGGGQEFGCGGMGGNEHIFG